MFPPYLFAYAETLRAEPSVAALRQLATAQGARLWITGGTLRDALLTRWPHDLDLAVDGDVERLGRALADEVSGTFVPLDPDTGTVRVAVPSNQGIDWFDMVRLRGNTIGDDLAARDFTINAIALPLDGRFDDGSAEFVDPTGGRPDLHAQVLRMTSRAALEEDPLRVLRAYRFGAVLGFSIEDRTRTTLRELAATCAAPAPERVAQELRALLTAPDPTASLAAMAEDRVLHALLPELAAGIGVSQNGFHHLDVWGHTLETLRLLGPLLGNPQAFDSDDLFAYAGDPGHRESVAWAALFHDVAKPECRSEDADGVHFFGHDTVGAAGFADIARRLRLPGALARRAGRLIRNHLRPLHLGPMLEQGAVTPRAVDRLYRDLEGDVPGLFLLALADCRAALGPARRADAEDQLIALYRHLSTCHRERIAPVDDAPPLVTGHDLMKTLKIAEGPLVGRLLALLRGARIEGTEFTRDEALAWLRERHDKTTAEEAP